MERNYAALCQMMDEALRSDLKKAFNAGWVAREHKDELSNADSAFEVWLAKVWPVIEERKRDT